ncbi:MAG: hypothetical protein ACU4F9_09915 [Arcticibacter sp.]
MRFFTFHILLFFVVSAIVSCADARRAEPSSKNPQESEASEPAESGDKITKLENMALIKTLTSATVSRDG